MDGWNVTLFESEKTFGGHTLTDETIPGVPVDLGFQVQSARRPPPSRTKRTRISLVSPPATRPCRRTSPPPRATMLAVSALIPFTSGAGLQPHDVRALRAGTPPGRRPRPRARASSTGLGWSNPGWSDSDGSNLGWSNSSSRCWAWTPRRATCPLRSPWTTVRCPPHLTPPSPAPTVPPPSKSQRTDTSWGNTLLRLADLRPKLTQV